MASLRRTRRGGTRRHGGRDARSSSRGMWMMCLRQSSAYARGARRITTKARRKRGAKVSNAGIKHDTTKPRSFMMFSLSQRGLRKTGVVRSYHDNWKTHHAGDAMPESSEETNTREGCVSIVLRQDSQAGEPGVRRATANKLPRMGGEEQGTIIGHQASMDEKTRSGVCEVSTSQAVWADARGFRSSSLNTEWRVRNLPQATEAREETERGSLPQDGQGSGSSLLSVQLRHEFLLGRSRDSRARGLSSSRCFR